MKKLFLGTLGLLALASCSDDELTSVNRNGDEIMFNVVTNSVSRAADVYCNDNPPEQFYVSARHNNKTFIDSDNIKYNTTNSKWEDKDGTRYWPAAGDVTFFAYHNADADSFEWNLNSTNNTVAPSVTFTVAETVTNQKDFIYARETQAKPASGGQVTLNFRHALSQIVFMAKNTNPNLYVEIYGVSVCNVKGGKGEFSYPNDDTADNMVDADHDGDFTPNPSVSYYTGTWNLNTATAKVNYVVSWDTAKALEGSASATAVSLTNTVSSTTEFDTKAMLLLPQTTTAWVPTTGGSKPAEQDNTYFLVKCKIYNVAGNSVSIVDGTVDEVCLWGDGEAQGKEVAIPVALSWEQGKKYIYTFVFGNGNGGYDPEQPNTPILVPITFNVTVDDFITGSNDKIDKPMQTN